MSEGRTSERQYTQRQISRQSGIPVTVLSLDNAMAMFASLGRIGIRADSALRKLKTQREIVEDKQIISAD